MEADLVSETLCYLVSVTETDLVSETLCFLVFTFRRGNIQFPKGFVFYFVEYQAMGRSENPVILSIIHHRQNP
jgi:hypothetical protein